MVTYLSLLFLQALSVICRLCLPAVVGPGDWLRLRALEPGFLDSHVGGRGCPSQG